MTTSFEEMSSEELFELAKSRQMEEEKSIREELKKELDDLRKKRREIAAQYKKELTQVDDDIERIRERMSPNSAAASRSKSSSTNISAAVLNTLQTHKRMSTKTLQTELESNGIVAANLSQTLAYLKRQGKVISPERAVYEIV